MRCMHMHINEQCNRIPLPQKKNTTHAIHAHAKQPCESMNKQCMHTHALHARSHARTESACMHWQHAHAEQPCAPTSLGSDWRPRDGNIKPCMHAYMHACTHMHTHAHPTYCACMQHMACTRKPCNWVPMRDRDGNYGHACMHMHTTNATHAHAKMNDLCHDE